MPGAGAEADPSRSEPELESALGPWRPGAGAGAALKSGGSATLHHRTKWFDQGKLGTTGLNDLINASRAPQD